MQGTVPKEVLAAPSAVPDLLGTLRSRRAQAQQFSAPYLAPVIARDSMLLWLARAAVAARKAADRKQVHIAASANRDQSSIFRFEQAAEGKGGWPRDADRIISAYADDLDIEPIDLWAHALEMWRADRADRVVPINPAAEAASFPGPDPELPAEVGEAHRRLTQGGQPKTETPARKGSRGSQDRRSA